MKKIGILLTSALVLMGCSFQKSDLDKELLNLMEIKEVEFKHEKDDEMFMQIIKANDNGVYFSTWLDEDRVVQKGLKRVSGEKEDVLIDLTEEDYGIDSFVQLDGKIYYVAYNLGAHNEETPDSVGPTNYTINIFKDKESTNVLKLKDEMIVNPPKLFVIEHEVFVIVQTVNKKEETRAFIYNISEEKEMFSIDGSKLSMHSDFISNETTRGLENDKLVFAVTKENGEDIASSIYTFDGKEVKENIYKNIYIYDVTMIKDHYMFAYNENPEDVRYIGYLNADEDLVKTEIGVSNINKALDIKDGSIIYGRIGNEGDEMYHYVEISGMDISFESISIMGNGFIKQRATDGFVTIDNSKNTKTIVKYFKNK